jgi:2-polyprenyl-3-methyl-5-hydroxy-6-metoxy-1,4-benzoquinol methylase
MPGRDDWMAVADTADSEEIRERILTGYKDGRPFTPYVPIVPMPCNIRSVLDFGCGLGRNFSYLKRTARSVVAFDLPPMIEQCRRHANDDVDFLSSDWNEIRVRRFDLIFASLVLQHVEPDSLRTFLADFAHMASAVYLLTPTRTDFGENLLDIIAATGRFEPGECVDVDHDPVTHQLRVLGRTSFDAARRAGHERYFEMLLQSK